jgi:NodT family efflux transporter outer membrane factor (OMF) lipoprotein
MRRSWIEAVLLAGLAGCTVGPNFVAPKPDVPASFARHEAAQPASATVSLPVIDAWWTQFHDPTLTSLEQRVATANLDVRVAALRLVEARANYGVVDAQRYPTVNGNLNVTREAQASRGVLALLSGSSSPAGSANGAGGTTSGVPSGASPLANPFELYQAGFDASWEADLWGRVKRSLEQAKANVDVSAETAHEVLIASQAELARDYIQLRGVQAQTDIVDRTLSALHDTLALVRDRFANGLTTESDVTNEQALLASTQAQLPALQQQAAQTINAIALLLGEQPGALRPELAADAPVPPVPPVVPVGLPSELTRRRPDIRAAEAQLHAATAGVGVAVADFYPRFTLSASAALQAVQPHYLTDWGARTFGIGPAVTLPIFEGGRLKRTLELRETQQKEAAVKYQQAVLQALHDVDNALIAYSAEAQRRVQLAVAVANSRRTLALARERYQGGLGDFLTVLDAERQLLAAEQSYNDSTTRISTNLVALCQALGGGWQA